MTRARAGTGDALVRLPNWLGDTLMARPFLAALRARAGHVTAVGPAALLELLAPERAWDEAVSWPLAPGALAALRGRRFAAAYVLPPSFSSAWFAWRAGARERIGFAADARSFLLTRALRRPPRGERHLAREYLALLDEDLAAHDVFAIPPPLAVDPEAVAEAEALLAEAVEPGRRWDGLYRTQGPGPRPLAILAPGASYGPAKRWPVERFAFLAEQLRPRGVDVIVCGSPGDRRECDGVEAACNALARSLAGRTSMPVQAALCARAFVVVSNDSGLAHLAAAVGAPTLTIFGSTSSAWTAPLGPRSQVLQRPPVCSPCFRRDCAIRYACLEAVKVDEVLRAIEALGLRAPAGAAS